MTTAAPDQSRARVFDSEREERVQVCLRLMPHQWVRGKTAKELAKKHGESLAVWEQASAEAWRRHKAQDVDWLRGYLCSALLDAHNDAQEIDVLRDRVKAVVEVVKAWAPLVGANAPTKLEHSGHVALDVTAQSPELTAALNVGDMRLAAKLDAYEAMRCLSPEDRDWVNAKLGETVPALPEKAGG